MREHLPRLLANTFGFEIKSKKRYAGSRLKDLFGAIAADFLDKIRQALLHVAVIQRLPKLVDFLH